MINYFLQKNYSKLNRPFAEKIAVDLDELIDLVTDGSLTRASTFVINKNLDVHDKSLIYHDFKHMQAQIVSSARLYRLCVIRSVPPENTLSTGTLVTKE